MSAAATRAVLEFFSHVPVSLEKPVSKAQFIAWAKRYPELRMERKANGKVTIMSPVKKGSGYRESWTHFFVMLWHYHTRLGEVYSPSTGIELPDGAIKSPDCAWISEERLATLSEDADERFLQAVPDFVAEVRSSTDSLAKLKKKMTNTWMRHGVRLAWLIDPYSEQVWIYRQGRETEEVKGFDDSVLSGEDVLPGMELPLVELKVKKKE